MASGGRYRSRSWIDPRVETRRSIIHGNGTFARGPFKKGEVIVIWGGTIFTQEEIKAGKAKRGSIAEIGEGLYLAESANGPDSPDNYMNHSCDPNVWMDDEITLVARREIEAGQELTADYAMWGADPDWELSADCRCGSPGCRTRVTGNDWKLAELQDRYAGHFSPYINERITNAMR